MAVTLAARVWSAQGDAWQVRGRIREPLGGGATELPGVRLMASGIPDPRWNTGDVSELGRVDLEAVRRWYATRAHGRGVPWGLRVPAPQRFTGGRHVMRMRCMGLDVRHFRPAVRVPDVTLRAAGIADLEAAARVDAQAFGDPEAITRAWLEPELGAGEVTVAIAVGNGGVIGLATGIHSDGRAGRAVGLFGLGVLESARGRGIAAALSSWLVERGIERGASLAHVNPDHDLSARIHVRLGFVESGGLDVYVDL